MKATQPRQSDQQPRRPAAEPDRAALAPSDAQFVDNRPEAIAQRRLADAIHNSQPAQARRRATDAIHHSPYMVAQRQQLRGMFGEAAQLQAGPEEEELLQGKFAAVQRQAGPEEEELLQGTFAPVQRQAGPEEEELLQGTFAPVQRQAGPEEEELLQGKFAPVQREEAEPDTEPRKNNTGLPDHLKPGIESLSGMSMDAVRVHYNSSQPAQLNALAYAQGTDIHVAPGQEQHLPHEAWHIVQQAQGRVKPTMQLKDGLPVNDDQGLEHEADVMGAKAMQLKASPHSNGCGCASCTQRVTANEQANKLQAMGVLQAYSVVQLKCEICASEDHTWKKCPYGAEEEPEEQEMTTTARAPAKAKWSRKTGGAATGKYQQETGLAKKVQHHDRPEYAELTRLQSQYILQGNSRKEAKREAKEQLGL